MECLRQLKPFLTLLPALAVASTSFSQASPDEILISGFEAPVEDEWAGNASHAYPLETAMDESLVKQGTASAKWIIDRSPWLQINTVPSDWSDAFALSLWVYGEEALEQEINLVVDVRDADGSEGYFIHQFPVTWEGWQEVIVPLSDFKSSTDGLSLENVASMRITAQGWNARRIPGAVVYLDDLKLLQ